MQRTKDFKQNSFFSGWFLSQGSWKKTGKNRFESGFFPDGTTLGRSHYRHFLILSLFFNIMFIGFEEVLRPFFLKSEVLTFVHNILKSQIDRAKDKPTGTIM